jgi:glycosyltransferase involved in cell wall biosynthesis
MPKVSIVTPVHCDTSAKVDWLAEMIESVRLQSLSDWELILIDDKSPLPLDSVRLRCAADGRLRWLENAKNSKPSKTRNTAVALAESDCILPLDADDMLASSEVLEHMYDTWSMDKSKIIYGDLQLYRIGSGNQFQRSPVVKLGEYTFELAMNLGGIMPVTAMHSVECHYQAGGWKTELDEGLEDVEYWIAAGERGFCGQKIPYITLVYRRQENSRAYVLKHITKNFRAMQQKIKEMHAPIYKGEFPMACCGKGASNAPGAKSVDPAILSAQNQKVSRITELSDYDENDLIWVAYQGGKQARFDILARGPSGLPSSYTVFGTGHYFQVHKQHRAIFEQRQHLGFRVNQPDPREQPEPEQVVAPRQEVQVIEYPKPELSTLIRPDKVASRTREMEIQEIIIEPNAAESYSDTMPIQMPTNYFEEMSIDTDKIEIVAGSLLPIIDKLSLSSLGISDKLTKILNENGYTVENLTETTPQKLSSLPGIGIKRASRIIDIAKGLME